MYVQLSFAHEQCFRVAPCFVLHVNRWEQPHSLHEMGSLYALCSEIHGLAYFFSMMHAIPKQTSRIIWMSYLQLVQQGTCTFHALLSCGTRKCLRYRQQNTCLFTGRTIWIHVYRLALEARTFCLLRMGAYQPVLPIMTVCSEAFAFLVSWHHLTFFCIVPLFWWRQKTMTLSSCACFTSGSFGKWLMLPWMMHPHALTHSLLWLIVSAI